MVPVEEYKRPADLHYVIDDTMGETWHPLNGQHYESKSEFRKVTKMLGGVEVGNEKQKAQDNFKVKGNLKQDIREAYYQLKEGNRR